MSCDRVKKLSRKTKARQRNKPKTCPAGFGTHSQSYMRTRQKCNPEYIPLYLRSAMNNYIVMTNGLILRDRAQEAKNMILTDHDEEIQRT